MLDAFEPVLDRLRHRIASMPEYLLETDGGPVGLEADVIFADLITPDDDVRTIRLDRVRPDVLVPIARRPTPLDETDLSMLIPGEARYVLQGCWGQGGALARNRQPGHARCAPGRATRTRLHVDDRAGSVPPPTVRLDTGCNRMVACTSGSKVVASIPWTWGQPSGWPSALRSAS